MEAQLGLQLGQPEIEGPSTGMGNSRAKDLDTKGSSCLHPTTCGPGLGGPHTAHTDVPSPLRPC